MPPKKDESTTTATRQVKRKDAATLSTSGDALPSLQREVTKALGVVAKTSEGRPLHVGIIGPGEKDNESPQVNETLASFGAFPAIETGKRKGVLHVYHYKKINEYKNVTLPANVTLRHHLFDLTNPDPEDTHRNDLLIATRVVNPVMSELGRKDMSLREGVAKALAGKAEPKGYIFTDFNAAMNLRRDHPGAFKGRTVTQTGRTPRDVGIFAPTQEPTVAGPSHGSASAATRRATVARNLGTNETSGAAAARQPVQKAPATSALARRLSYRPTFSKSPK
jgi:hypothetical protein